MRQNWAELRIGDLGKIVTGKTPSTTHPSYFGDKFPFITPTDMDGRKKVNTTERYLSDEGAKLQKTLLIPENSVAVSCIGWQMGKVIMTSRPSFTNQQLNTIIPNEKVDANYLFYALSVRRSEFLSLGSATGVRTPILNKSTFSELRISLPPLPFQRRVADILSAYDDLIENNTNRIHILEGMAQAIYQEWFGKVGKESLPNGWRIETLGNTCVVVLGGTPSRNKSEYWNGGNIPWIKSGKLNDIRIIDSTEYITKLGLENSSTKIMPSKTVVIAITGEILISFLEKSTCANQSVIGVYDSDFESQEYLHLYLKEKIQEFKNKMSGSAQQHINKEIVSDTQILLPPNEDLQKFNKHIQPIYSLLANLLFRNANLRQTRDLFLPRLVSGELDVSSLS